MPSGTFEAIQRNGDVIRWILLDHPFEHDCEAIHRIRRQAVARRKAADGKVSAIGLRHAIDDQE